MSAEHPFSTSRADRSFSGHRTSGLADPSLITYIQSIFPAENGIRVHSAVLRTEILSIHLYGYTYNCMGGARSSFRRLTYKYCLLDPSKTSFSQVLSILHTLLSLIFFRAHRNTVQCAEHLYIHLHSNDTHTAECTHTFLAYK